MAYSGNIQNKVRKLRAKGQTYSEIKKELKLSMPKSTLSSWCRDVVLPSWYTKKVEKLNYRNLRKAQRLAVVSNELKRERFLKEITNNNKYLKNKIKDRAVLKALLSILYLGEGAKWKSHRGLMLGSSDPIIIKIYIRLLKLCYDISSNQLKCRVSYRADQDIKLLEKYWSSISGISIHNFYKTKSDPRTIGKLTKRKDYKGVCVLTCKGTNIQLELDIISKLILAGL